ncbi:2-oxo acid dehydrogenase subunit E2 [Tautonia plasticadhaerens]|uniref:2-oxoacid dehydrogenases acyltransferase (Catalytic domain) n=1 Tax=Tautonia plasticadhaerens TaxID=2527974 RepID=A0A518H830_9BACT|nr:2-oxo acid dehydrogenase subunit E2 [Tautonia plasticadhaerens]QDV37010.1 2-oxoacid dehydrogenases acyltransferase (catalytic domain) [Tautonia plasticadhaerens]
MPQPKGRTLPLSGPRRFILDMMHFARQVPSVPVGRAMRLGPLAEARRSHPIRPSWPVLFLKAYGLVCDADPGLRRALLTVPRLRLYEHPYSIAALAMEREHEGEPCICVGLFRAPERQSISELQEALDEYRSWPLERVGFFRQMLRISGYPAPIRRFLWWSTLACSGPKRAKRLGTFGLSSYGALGAESYHPISPLTTTLTYGPIDASGLVTVKLIYDHRVLDGAQVARRLADLEEALLGPVLDELLGLPAGAGTEANRPADRGAA